MASVALHLAGWGPAGRGQGGAAADHSL